MYGQRAGESQWEVYLHYGSVRQRWWNSVLHVDSFQKDTHTPTEETSAKRIAVLVECVLGIFKSSSALNYKVSGRSNG